MMIARDLVQREFAVCSRGFLCALGGSSLCLGGLSGFTAEVAKERPAEIAEDCSVGYG